MGTDEPTVVVQGYLIVEAARDHAGTVRGARLTGTRKGRPWLQGDQVAVALTLRLPRAVFGPVRIAADVLVDADTLPAVLTLTPAGEA